MHGGKKIVLTISYCSGSEKLHCGSLREETETHKSYGERPHVDGCSGKGQAAHLRLRVQTSSDSDKEYAFTFYGSARAFIVMPISASLMIGLYSKNACLQTEPHIPQNMLRKVNVQKARWQQRSPTLPPFRTRARESA